MQVTDSLIDQLAKLAMLEFSGAERQAIKEDLTSMTVFVEKLNELDTTGVEPLRHMCTGQSPTRPDVAAEPMLSEQALAQAPDARPPYFAVPKFIKP